MRPIRFHDLRHTFGTGMVAAGTPLPSVQEWLGHADSKTKQVYTHYAPSEGEGEQVDAAFGSGGAKGSPPSSSIIQLVGRLSSSRPVRPRRSAAFLRVWRGRPALGL